MNDQTHRTFICSIVFIDLVGFSRKPVAEQIRIKTSLTNNLSEAIKDIPAGERIILDTGDGAAISFLGDPEDALFTTLALREAMMHEGGAGPDSGMETLRMGINLGPVRLAKDINGHPNIIGDGINVAQRIQGFAQPGQIVVSRSYYDVVANIADEYARLFTYEGSRTDKHVREHEIYVVGQSEDALKVAQANMKDRVTDSNAGPKRAKSAAAPTGATTVTLTIPAFVRDRKMLTIAAGVLAGVVVLLGVLVVSRRNAPPEPDLAVATAKLPGAPTLAPVPAVAPLKTESASGAAPGKTETGKAEAGKPAATPVFAKDEPGKPTAAPTAPAVTAAPASPGIAIGKPTAATVPGTPAAVPGTNVATTPAGTVPAAPTQPPASLIFAIQPWGEVFVNGKSSGVSPPMKSIKLAPGKYKIEVRNTTFASFSEDIELKSRDELTIRHRFQ